MNISDENIHSTAGAWAFKHKLHQSKPSADELTKVERLVRECANTLYEHEKEIVEITFSKGKIDGITKAQVIHFVESRINTCLEQLGYEKMFDVKYDPISAWFYSGINNYQFNDFFSGVGREYNRNWDESRFTWSTDKGQE